MNRRLEAYRLAVDAVALGAAVIAVPGAAGSAGWPLSLLLLALGVAAMQFPLRLSLTHKVSVATGVFFAAALLLPPGRAALLAAAAGLVSSAVSVLRRRLASGQAPRLRQVLASAVFNAAQGCLSVLAGAAVLALGGVSAGSLGATAALAPAVAAALTMYLVNLALVSSAVALAAGNRPLRVFLDAQRAVALSHAALYALGACLAAATFRYPAAPLLAAFPAAAAYALLRRAVQMSRETIRAVERMADTVDRRDPYTYQHSRRVAEYSTRLARRLGFSGDEIVLLNLAAKVHDLGKIGIPDSVLLKPGRLSPAEEEQMRAHPRLGYEILSEFREYAKVRELVLVHHERFAGGGYPNGTVAGGLPLLAQVIPVADSLDAMTTARPYRAPLPWRSALEELARGAGGQWNPRVVAAALAEFGAQAEAAPEGGAALPLPAAI